MAKQTLKVLRELQEDEKVAPQAKVILNTIVTAVGVGETIDMDDLVNKLTDSGELNTRQEPKRVVAYYLPKLKEAGLVEVEKVAGADDEEGEPKPKRTRKAKAEAEPAEVNPGAGGDEVNPEAAA